jgi:NAD(P)-dependent dehydrogenase (short-subunit alcohol dehydrogenase family)
MGSAVGSHPFDLTGKVALVTGGNSGIGLAAANALARAGAAVAIWGRGAERNERAAAELSADGATVFADTVDVVAPEQVRAGFDRVVSHLGRVDCVFANAGTGDHAASFLDITAEMRDALLSTNLGGAWETVACAVRHMVGRAADGDPGGSIIANGSLSVFRGLRGGEHYGASKAAMSVVMKGIAVEYGRFGVRANTVCPGFIEKDGRPGRFEAALVERGPIPRYGRADEIGGIIVYLASDAASYHTGDVITIDGGWTSLVV